MRLVRDNNYMFYKALLSATVALAVLTACGDSTNSEPKQAAVPKVPTASATSMENDFLPPIPKEGDRDKPQFIAVASPSYPPFNVRAENGEMSGLDIELLHAIAKHENFTVTVLAKPPQVAFSALDNGDSDIVAAGLHMTPENLEHYDFSVPYLETSWVVLVKDGMNIPHITDLGNKRIAVQKGTNSERQLRKILPNANIIPVATVYLGFQKLERGEVDAVYDVETTLKSYTQDKQLKLVTDVVSGKISLGFALVKDNAFLRSKINDGLTAIRKDGTYQKILDKWSNLGVKAAK